MVCFNTYRYAVQYDLRTRRQLTSRHPMTDNYKLSQSAPTYKQAFLDSQQSVNKARVRDVLANNGKVLWGCADRTVSWNSGGVVYFTRLTDLSPEDKQLRPL